jgi:class 3 adenylate cyclase
MASKPKSASPEKLRLAIIFADISGRTQLYERLGDAPARRMVRECLNDMSEVVKNHKGVLVRPIGDEILCTFANVQQAVAAACELHRLLPGVTKDDLPSKQGSLSIRVGLHYGSVHRESGDIFGDAVNVAARMVAQAKAGQIITTRATVEKLPIDLQAAARLIDRAPIKGKKEEIELYEVIWQVDEITRLATGVIGEETPGAKLRVRYHDREIELDRDRPSLTLGRSETADVCVDETLASRQHVRFELRHGKYFVIDQSTNGTYVRAQSGPDTFLRRETMLLSGNGMISLGRPLAENPTEVVYFTHEP